MGVGVGVDGREVPLTALGMVGGLRYSFEDNSRAKACTKNLFV